MFRLYRPTRSLNTNLVSDLKTYLLKLEGVDRSFDGGHHKTAGIAW